MFSVRLLIEFLKENQEVFENALPINMGQILSIPFILVGLYFVFRRPTSKIKSNLHLRLNYFSFFVFSLSLITGYSTS